MEEPAFDPSRRLCPDGSCVGVIGADGRCSVCARTAGAAVAELAGASAAESAAAELVDAASGFDPTRRLCDDGSCVGVVGADGLCGTCGRKAD
jgi:hypothetical protein